MQRHGVPRWRLCVRVATVAGAAALFCAGVPAGLASARDDEQADLSVTMSDSADPVKVGDEVDYAIKIADHGPGDASRARVQIVLPDGLQFVSASGAQSCTTDGGISCTVGDLPNGATATIVVQARATAEGTFTAIATATSPWLDTKPDDNTARESTTVLGPSRLVVIDKVTNDDGGTAAAREFGVRVDGGDAKPSAFPGDEQGTTVQLQPGPYAVTAVGGPAGYDTALSLECSGTIAPGERKVCTIANDDRPAHLTVVQHVLNGDGGRADASSFHVSVNAASASPASFSGAEAPGTAVRLAAGSYSVTVDPALGYETTLAPECSGTLALAEARTCTITSDDLAPLAVGLRAGETSVVGGSAVDYVLTLTNRNGKDIVARGVTVTLPEGFAYRAGSASGAAGGPRVDGQKLTWDGPLDVPAQGSTTLRFAATAPTTAGDYAATAGASADAPFTVAADSSAAVVTVRHKGSSGSGPGPGPGTTTTTTNTTTTPTTSTTTTTTPDPSVPPPVFQQSADVEPVAGTVLIRLPGASDFVPLTAAEQVPIGAELDATEGRVALSTVDAAGTAYRAEFSEGRFKVDKQQANGVTVLRLTGGNFATCKATKRALASVDKKKKPKRPAKSKKSVRHLWGSGKGKFQTRGRYVAATVHGTTWFTEDRCDASRVYVQEGIVGVRDLVLRRTIQLPAGKSYVARPRR